MDGIRGQIGRREFLQTSAGAALAAFAIVPRQVLGGVGYTPPSEKEWLAACQTGSPAGTHIGYSGPLTETVLLGTVAYRTGQQFEWDAANLKATNCPNADPHIRYKYRNGWTL